MTKLRVFTTITFRDKYNNFYRVKIITCSLVSSAYLRRIIKAQISDLPNNRVDSSSICVNSEFHRLEVLKSADEICSTLK